MRAWWLERSAIRERSLYATGFLLLGAILARGAIVGPASSCERAPLHRGGDMIPFFCADYGAAWSGWPLLVAGLACIGLGIVLFHRAAGATSFPVTLRAALSLAVVGAALLYGAWTEGSVETCTSIMYDSSPGMPPETTCSVRPEPWRDGALVAAGGSLGAALALAAAVALRVAKFR